MKGKPALGAVLFLIAVPFAGSEVVGPAWSVVVVLLGIGAGWFLVPGFWRGIFYGGIAGVTAGLLVLGPGLRVAMRVVAVVDPVRTTEFTVGGTMFIIVGIGAMMGGIFGVFGNVSRIGFNLPSGAASLVPALLVLTMIGLDTELRDEVLELGAGPWLNIPMFAAVAFAYGWVWARIDGRLEEGRLPETRQGPPEPATMSLTDPGGHET